MRPIVFCMLTSVALLGGCRSRVTFDPDVVPEPFELKLLALHTDQRALYFVVTDERKLQFGGGYAAHARNGLPAGELTKQQIARLWRTIVEGDLLNVDGQFMPHAQTVRYDLDLRAGAVTRRLTCADDDAPALGELESTLHAWYTEYRAEQLMKPVERAIRQPPKRRK